jgi:hypothetical protein
MNFKDMILEVKEVMKLLMDSEDMREEKLQEVDTQKASEEVKNILMVVSSKFL